MLRENPALILAVNPSHALHCFPDICSMFPFCVASEGSEMEKLLPRPLQPHGKGGEQSVRSPPATVGHICGQLSPLLQSEPLSAARPASAPFSSQIQKNCVITKDRCTPPCSLCFSTIFSPDTVYIDSSRCMKIDHPFCKNGGEGCGHISRAVHRCP